MEFNDSGIGITLGLYYLLARKKWTPLRCIVLLLVVGIGFEFLGNVLNSGVNQNSTKNKLGIKPSLFFMINCVFL